MPALRDVQAAFRTALLGGDEEPARDAIHPDGLTATARLAIYRHHVVTTLTDVLADTFPVVRRLVDARFFAYAADRYLRAHPPTDRCLFAYGATFPGFLATFPPCHHLAYLPDVARLEWAFNVAFHAADVPALTPTELAAVPEADAARLRLHAHPSVSHLRSAWPVDRVWEAHRGDGCPERMRLEMEETFLEVRRDADDVVVFTRLDPGDFAFRRALAAGACLGDAAAAGMAADPAFDLPAALTAVLRDNVLVGFGIQAAKGDHHDERQRAE
jgi:hypothetical protein